MFARLAQDYQVPLQSLLSQGQDGTWQINQPAQPQQPAFNPADLQRLVSEQVNQTIQQQTTQQEIASFAAQKDKYPHFDACARRWRDYCRSNSTQDLPSAYEAALGHPPLRPKGRTATTAGAGRGTETGRGTPQASRSSAPQSRIPTHGHSYECPYQG